MMVYLQLKWWWSRQGLHVKVKSSKKHIQWGFYVFYTEEKKITQTWSISFNILRGKPKKQITDGDLHPNPQETDRYGESKQAIEMTIELRSLIQIQFFFTISMNRLLGIPAIDRVKESYGIWDWKSVSHYSLRKNKQHHQMVWLAAN